MLLESGETGAAAELAASLDPAALGMSLGGTSWDTRLDALRARILTGHGESGQCPIDIRSGG